MALIVAVLGGFGQRTDQTVLGPIDTLHEIVAEAISGRELPGPEIRSHLGRVGFGSHHLDLAFNFVRHEVNNDERNALLCAGKGYGARALANVLFRFESHNVPMHYGRVGFVSLNAGWKDRPDDARLRLPRRWVDVAVNVRRPGQHGGARFEPRDFASVAFVNEQAVLVDDPDVDARRHHREFESRHRSLIATAIGDACGRLGY